MSVSPVKDTEIAEAARLKSRSPYQKQIQRINDLMRSGGTLSGYERHCAFLNLHGRRFATISASSGFDFEDDGRGLALMDWDRDGRLDLWASNRTAPQVRFLRNQCPRAGNWIAVRLEGTVSNRDAIGSRVELTLDRDDRFKSSRTLKAGEGFLSQSSKWIHFGLGASETIAAIHIHWPNGETETVPGVPVNAHYQIVEGSGTATAVAPIEPREIPAAVEQPLVIPEEVSRAAVFLHHRVPLPDLPYQAGTTGRPERWEAERQPGVRAHLINLWAEWCVPCREELAEWTQNADLIRRSGLDVLALHAPDVPDGGTAEARFMEELEFPFPWGRASSVTVELLAKTFENVLGIQRDLPVPVSFLISPRGELAAMYSGKTDLDSILEDVEKLPLEGDARHLAAAPFPGRWLHDRPSAFHVVYIPVTLMRHRHIHDAVAFIDRHEKLMLGSENYPLILGGIAERLMQRGDEATATRLYRRSVELDSNDVAILNNLAWQLATSSNDALRDGSAALKWARRAIELAGEDPLRLDTLAAALAENGEFEEALVTARRGLALAEERGLASAVPNLQKGIERYKVGKPYRSTPD